MRLSVLIGGAARRRRLMDLDDAMSLADTNSLTLGLRALATLARRGPLDVDRLARLHECRVQQTEAVVAELERDGLIHRLADARLFVLTRRGVALIGDAPIGLH